MFVTHGRGRHVRLRCLLEILGRWWFGTVSRCNF